MEESDWIDSRWVVHEEVITGIKLFVLKMSLNDECTDKNEIDNMIT